jgi:hypothetical protein
MWKPIRRFASLAVSLASAAIAISAAAAEPLCDESEFTIESDYRYNEEDFTAEAAEQTLAALRGPFREWLARAVENGWDGDLNHGELGMAYLNNLNHLQGVILRQSALAEQVAGQSGEATNAFCDFLASTPIID